MLITCPRCGDKQWQVPKQWTTCRECGRMYWVTQDWKVAASDPDDMSDSRLPPTKPTA